MLWGCFAQAVPMNPEQGQAELDRTAADFLQLGVRAYAI